MLRHLGVRVIFEKPDWLRRWWRDPEAPGDALEHHALAHGRGAIHTFWVAFIVAFASLILGVWGEIDGDRIARASSLAWDTLMAAVSGGTLVPMRNVSLVLQVALFWGFIAVLALVLFWRFHADDRKDEGRTLDLFRAIHRVPNLRVIRSYPQYHRTLADKLQETLLEVQAAEAEGALPADLADRAAAGIRSALLVIATLGREFTQATSARYGANLMLIVGPQNGPTPFPPDLVSRLRFHRKSDLGALSALLYLPEDLLVRGGEADSRRGLREVPLIALPVPPAEVDAAGHRLAIPGAPSAVVSGQPSNYYDARVLADEWCTDFSAEVRADIRRYFLPRGDGRDVRSFASFRLGTADDPIGVLNVDSDQPGVLGREPEFHATFYALIAPWLDLLATHAVQYARLRATAGGSLVPTSLPAGGSFPLRPASLTRRRRRLVALAHRRRLAVRQALQGSPALAPPTASAASAFGPVAGDEQAKALGITVTGVEGVPAEKGDDMPASGVEFAALPNPTSGNGAAGSLGAGSGSTGAEGKPPASPGG